MRHLLARRKQVADAAQPKSAVGSIEARYPDRNPALFLDLAKQRLEIQLGVIDAVDNKLGMLISLASALIGILVAVFAIRGTDRLGTVDYALLAASVFLYVVIAVWTYLAYFARSWEAGPTLRALWRDLWSDRNDDSLSWRLASSYSQSFEKNLPAQRLKSHALRRALQAVIAQTLILVAVLIVVAAGH